MELRSPFRQGTSPHAHATHTHSASLSLVAPHPGTTLADPLPPPLAGTPRHAAHTPSQGYAPAHRCLAPPQADGDAHERTPPRVSSHRRPPRKGGPRMVPHVRNVLIEQLFMQPHYLLLFSSRMHAAAAVFAIAAEPEPSMSQLNTIAAELADMAAPPSRS